MFQEAPREGRELISLANTSVLAREVVRLMGGKFNCDLIVQANYLIENFPRIEFRRRLNEHFAKILSFVVIATMSLLFAIHLLRGYGILHWKWFAVPIAVSLALIWFWDTVVDKEWVNFFLGKIEGSHQLLEPFLIEYKHRATRVSLALYACKKYRELVGDVEKPEQFKERFEGVLKNIALQIIMFQEKKKLLNCLPKSEEESLCKLGSELRNWAYDASEWLRLIDGNITQYFRWAENEWGRKAESGEIEFLTNYQI